VVNLTLLLLIVMGGLGFIVIFELGHQRSFQWEKMSLHSRLVLIITALLILGGTLLFFILEYQNTIKNLPWGSKILVSLFQSITTRTAGFNTVDIGLLSNPTLFVIIILMAIGASPGSCGGGIKTTTFAIIVSFIVSRFRNRENVNLFFRRVPSHIVSKAISISFFTLVLIILGTTLLLISELAEVSHQESRGMFLELLFEVTSAFGTVGLSTGSTPNLTPLGRLIIVFLMFVGRLGPLTIALAIGRKDKLHYKYAEENVLVG
jgi:trk system potassium uptake protein TrkH